MEFSLIEFFACVWCVYHKKTIVLNRFAKNTLLENCYLLLLHCQFCLSGLLLWVE